MLADELFLLLEGARVCAQSIGTDSPCCRFVRMGEAILVVQTDDVDGAHRRAVAAGATITVPPTSWEVPSHDGSSVIRLRSFSMFDQNGIYSEINQHLS